MNGFVLTDAAIESALRPGQDVAAPADLTSFLAGAIAGQPRRARLWLNPAWPRLTPMMRLLLVLLLLIALVIAAVVIGSAPSTDYTNRPGWILLEHSAAGSSNDSVQSDGSERTLWLVRADGTGLHELAPGIPSNGKTNPVWSRDGTRIAFESALSSSVVFEMAIDGEPGQAGPYGGGCVTDREPPCFERWPAYAPDGNHLATVLSSWGGPGQQAIYVRLRDPDSSEVCSAETIHCFYLGAGLDSTVVATSTAWIEGLSWSPDGTQIAYYRVAKDAQGRPLTSELWLVNADGTDPRVIPLPNGLDAGDLDWSPDSSLIVFSSDPIHDWTEAGVAGQPDVYTVRPDGSDLRQLTHDGGSGAPSWTSDGKILFYRAPSMWLMDADGSNAAPVNANSPTLSGDASGWSDYGYWQPVP